MKKCTVCGLEKAAVDFQVRRLSVDGRTAACKACLHDRDASRYQKEKKRRSDWHKNYVKTKTGRKSSIRSKRKWADNNTVKRAAHIIVGNAIRDGKLLKKPCENCGSTRVHAHHDDYAKPLEVRWLCSAHHNDHHRKRQT